MSGASCPASSRGIVCSWYVRFSSAAWVASTWTAEGRGKEGGVGLSGRGGKLLPLVTNSIGGGRDDLGEMEGLGRGVEGLEDI